MSSDELIKFIINIFCQYYKYNIEEFKIKDSEKNLWGLSKVIDNKTEYVVFLDENNFENLDTSFLYNKNMIRDVEIIKVLVIDRNKEKGINWHILVERSNNEIVVVDKFSDKVLYYTPNINLFLNRMEGILEYRRKLKEEKVNRKINKMDMGTITTILIITNVIMYIFTAFLSGNPFDANVYVLIKLGAKENSLISQGEYYRFITAMFLHGGLVHLGFNMYALRALGPTVEKVFGKVRYIAIYFLGGIISVISSYIFSQEISIGASGAIFALLGAILVLAIKSKDRVGNGMVKNILSVIAMNIFIGFSLSNIDNYAHLGGLIGGILIAAMLKSKDSL